ncbi:alpha/beta fold hydrolase [Sulfobacillus thermosulfidooxidans]|uniref:alpha/beta fold hydrolase n=1 Tax=Sulfobacillus thermosulfidooxidans TaxID=28034 RepID=UPI00031F6BEC|nr:alpha/beta hydrolase [Sulfobacillus thermosulfidooxidans]
MSELITRQGTIYYEVTGNGPSVLFLHSALADHRQWREQVNALSPSYRCITYDLLGSGSSDNAPENYDPADTLLELLDHLKVDRVTLVGSSMGGSISIHAATRYPGRIQSIVLMGTGLFGFQPVLNTPEPTIYREYEAALANHDIDRLVDLAEAIWLIGIGGREEHVPKPYRELFRLMYREFLKNHGEFPQYRDMDDTSATRNLNMPVMVVVGDHDTAFCLAVATYFEQTLPGVNIVRMPGVAHFPNLSKPQVVNELLLEWLKKNNE